MEKFTIRTFDEIVEEEIRWLWKPYIAFGKISVIQGDPGNGKTTLALAIAAIISKRQKMPTGDSPPFCGNILYQSGEDNPSDTLKPRLIACGADCSRIAFIEANANLTPEMLKEAIETTNTKFVVLDPLQAFLTGKQDISRTKDMRPILSELGNVASKTGAAIVIIGHMNKGEKSKGIYRGLGSIDITAAARSVLLVGKSKDDPNVRHMAQIKNNLATFGKAVSFTLNGNDGVEFLGECDITEAELLSDKLPKKTKHQIASAIVIEMLADGDKKSNVMFDALVNAGITPATMDYTKKRLGVRSVNKDSDWYWTLAPLDEDETECSAIDETPVTFFDGTIEVDVSADVPPTITDPVPEPTHEPVPDSEPTLMDSMDSPYGKLTLIDWRNFAYER
jgi:archaellum biogenesis ATPase FlaH